MRRADRAYGVDARRIVEQHAAAAVHLHIDESGHQHLAVEIQHLCFLQPRIAGADQRLDARALDEHAAAFDEARIRENPGVAQGDRH